MNSEIKQLTRDELEKITDYYKDRFEQLGFIRSGLNNQVIVYSTPASTVQVLLPTQDLNDNWEEGYVTWSSAGSSAGVRNGDDVRAFASGLELAQEMVDHINLRTFGFDN